MAPTTRFTSRETPPPKGTKGCEADTVKKSRFFNAYDERISHDSLRSISSDFGITHPCARKWLQQRDELGSPAYRSTRKRSKILGRQSRVSKEQCQMLVSPSRNPVRDQLYEAQIKHHGLQIKTRQLQRRLKACTKGGQRYRQAYVKKEIT